MAIPVTFEQVTHNSPDGAQVGKSSTDKISLWGATPAAQPSGSAQAVVAATAVATGAITQVAVTDSLNGATFTGTALLTSATPTVDELEAIAGMLGLAVNAAGTDAAAHKVQIDKLVIDVAALIVLTNKLRADLVTLGGIAGA